MRSVNTLVLLAASTIVFAGCSANESSSNVGPDRSSLRGTPDPGNASTMNTNATPALNANPAGANSGLAQNNFWMEAASGGMAEVELGRLAQTKAQNAEVKQFAQMMVSDHTRSNDELKAVAAKKNIQLPASPLARHQETMQQLQKLSGADFDRAYVAAMVRDHEATVQLFESQMQGNSDPDARALAEKTLPVLHRHLEMIKGIQGKVK